jgi:hypothetical protein
MRHDDDDMTAMALEYIQGSGPPAHVREAFQDIPPAPLASFIRAFLSAQPHIDLAPLLRQICEVNQGRLEDLDSPDFLSYLIERTGANEMTMRRIRVSLGTFRKVVDSASHGDTRLAVAARDDSDGASRSTTASELLKLMKKRVK